MTQLHLEILDDTRKKVFSSLSSLNDVVLAGETALALQLGHRVSYDFDLFTSKPVSRSIYRTFESLLHESPTKLVDTADQLSVTLSSGVEITVLYYWYSPLYSTITTDSISLFDFHDIASDKALTLGRRNAWRDYLDLYTLFYEKHLTLAPLIKDSEKRFGNEFSSKLFLQQLSYTEDIHDESAVQLIHPVSKETITEFFVKEIKSYLRDQSIT